LARSAALEVFAGPQAPRTVLKCQPHRPLIKYHGWYVYLFIICYAFGAGNKRGPFGAMNCFLGGTTRNVKF